MIYFAYLTEAPPTTSPPTFWDRVDSLWFISVVFGVVVAGILFFLSLKGKDKDS